MNRATWKLMLASLMVAALASAQEDPGRGVARISLINGDVSVRRGDSGDWVAAAINAPLVVEDNLLTGAGSRAELQFDWANMIRLSSATEVRLAELEANRYLVQVAGGLVTFRVERDSDAEVEISTPSVSVRPLKKGSYRIMVRDDGESEITVRSGEAEVFTPQGSERLKSGRTLLARGSASDPEYQIVSAIEHDTWDRWNEDRDSYFSRAKSYRYVDQSVYGAEDLDGYGTWIYDAPYGYVWSPRVDAGWSPYYYGRWSWVDWYGWSWVSYDPWGWAPYHYGRWYHRASYGWCWYPGGFQRHSWSPGLVAFVGWGGGGIGVGFGRVGWIPLAPNEPYYPWYGRGYYRGYRNSTYIDNSVRIVNNTNVVNVYRNARVSNAITGMDGSQFGRGGSHVRIGENDLRRVDLVRGQLPVSPDRSSLRLSERPAIAAPVSRAPSGERFFSRRQPPQIERVPFEQQQRSMEQATRRTFGEAGARPVEGARGMAQAPAVRGDITPRGQASEVRSPGQAGGPDSGWRRLGGAAERNAARPAESGQRTAPAGAVSRPTAPSDNGGWRRFEPNRESGQPTRTPMATAPGRVERAAPTRQMETPRGESSRVPSSPSETPRPSVERRSEPLRISQPIVRQRETPQMEAPRVSAPRSEAPRMAPAPAAERPSGGGRVSPGGSDGQASPRTEGGGRTGGGRIQGRAR